MSDHLKLSDPMGGDTEADRIASAMEVAADRKRYEELKKNIHDLEKLVADKERLAWAEVHARKSQAADNKIGARKDSVFKAICTAPSFNRTPVGSTMVPLPYVTVSYLSGSIGVASSVRFNGRSVYTLGSSQPSCTGDERGSGGGVKSGTVNGEVKPTGASSTVRAEGKRVVRDGDPNTMNGGNNPGVYVTVPPASGAPPKSARGTSNPPVRLETPEERSAFKKWLGEQVDHLHQASAHPWEGLKGIGKGLANIPSEMLETLLKAAVAQHAAEIDEAVMTQQMLGQAKAAKILSEVSAETRKVGERIDVPKFSMSNAAQQGGALASNLVQLFAGGVGMVKNVGKGLASLGKADAAAKALGTAGKAVDATATATASAKVDALATTSVGGADDGVKIVGHAGGHIPAVPRTTYQEIVSQVPGKILAESDALLVGPLGDDLAGLPGTFSGGRYATIQLEKPMTAYRAWTPDQAREFGAFWSLEKPVGSLQTRIDSALLPEWGNLRGTAFDAQATKYTIVELPSGTVLHIGEVGSQGGSWVGGKSQLLIDGGVQPAWKIGESPLH